jgi:hypothetical protein
MTHIEHKTINHKKVIVLSSGLLQADGSFPNFRDGMYLGGQIRMAAAVRLVQKHPNTEIILVGGYDKTKRGDTWISQQVIDMANFLKQLIPTIKLTIVQTLPCTFHNFVGFINYMQARGIHQEEVDLLTNAYHLPRAQAFANQAAIQLCPEQPIRFNPLAAETILGKSIPSIVGDRMREYETRVTRERQGLDQLKAGAYQESCLGQNLQLLAPLIEEDPAALLTPDELAHYSSPVS